MPTFRYPNSDTKKIDDGSDSWGTHVPYKDFLFIGTRSQTALRSQQDPTDVKLPLFKKISEGLHIDAGNASGWLATKNSYMHVGDKGITIYTTKKSDFNDDQIMIAAALRIVRTNPDWVAAGCDIFSNNKQLMSKFRESAYPKPGQEQNVENIRVNEFNGRGPEGITYAKQ